LLARGGGCGPCHREKANMGMTSSPRNLSATRVDNTITSRQLDRYWQEAVGGDWAGSGWRRCAEVTPTATGAASEGPHETGWPAQTVHQSADRRPITQDDADLLDQQQAVLRLPLPFRDHVPHAKKPCSSNRVSLPQRTKFDRFRYAATPLSARAIHYYRSPQAPTDSGSLPVLVRAGVFDAFAVCKVLRRPSGLHKIGPGRSERGPLTHQIATDTNSLADAGR
jgi:hypothetical protein